MNFSEKSSLPALFSWLLRHALAPSYRESALGDLAEEYKVRRQASVRDAFKWLCHQTLRACFQWLNRAAGSRMLIVCSLSLLTVFVVPTVYLMVVWLSNMDAASPALWEPLLVGDMHKIVVQAEFWQVAIEATSGSQDLLMFIHVEAVLWVLVSVFALVLKQNTMTSHQLAGAGLILMLLPYVWGLLVLSTFPPGLKLIGPMLAFMLFCLLYMVLPLTWLVLQHRRRSRRIESGI